MLTRWAVHQQFIPQITALDVRDILQDGTEVCTPYGGSLRCMSVCRSLVNHTNILHIYNADLLFNRSIRFLLNMQAYVG